MEIITVFVFNLVQNKNASQSPPAGCISTDTSRYFVAVTSMIRYNWAIIHAVRNTQGLADKTAQTDKGVQSTRSAL